MALVQVPVGTKVRLSARFTNDSGAPDDPTTVTFRIVPPTPDTTEHLVYGTDSAVIRDDVGAYHVDAVIDQPGDWWWSAEGTGNVEAYHEALITGLTRHIAEAV